ncbi:MAG: uracil-DNA glycosylase [Nitrospirota bacterium]|jgi:DNA polymerase
MRLSSTRDVSTVLGYFEALGFGRLPIAVPGAGGMTRGEKARALEALRVEMGECRRCKLGKGRKNLVFGEGSPDAEVMFVGEAPGREEDLQGRPFVGDAGKLLTSLINRMGFKREEVYIANIIKSRPPGNRDPEAEEISACLPFLERQLEIIAPKVIVSLGRVSAHTLTGLNTPISRLRGHFHSFRGIALMPTFHPAYLLRNPRAKHLVWSDAKQVLELLGREVK